MATVYSFLHIYIDMFVCMAQLDETYEKATQQTSCEQQQLQHPLHCYERSSPNHDPRFAPPLYDQTANIHSSIHAIINPNYLLCYTICPSVRSFVCLSILLSVRVYDSFHTVSLSIVNIKFLTVSHKVSPFGGLHITLIHIIKSISGGA